MIKRTFYFYENTIIDISFCYQEHHFYLINNFLGKLFMALIPLNAIAITDNFKVVIGFTNVRLNYNQYSLTFFGRSLLLYQIVILITTFYIIEWQACNLWTLLMENFCTFVIPNIIIKPLICFFLYLMYYTTLLLLLCLCKVNRRYSYDNYINFILNTYRSDILFQPLNHLFLLIQHITKGII